MRKNKSYMALGAKVNKLLPLEREEVSTTQ